MTEVPFAIQNQEDSQTYESSDHDGAKRVLADKALDRTMATDDNQIDAEKSAEHPTDFGLTDPESRTYSPYEDYRFLIHVALNGVEQRASEIGTDRDGALMTSLVSNKRAATFNGEGGIIVAAPSDELITGMSAFDVGGEIQNGARASVEDLLQPADNSNYSQVDMKFRATKPIGVMIKRASTDGRELGTAKINEELRAYAKAHDLPVAEILVLPNEGISTEVSHEVQEMSDGSNLLTVVLPDTNEQYYKVQVLHGNAYHVHEGENSAARVMKVTAYGESTQQLTEDERSKMLLALQGAAAVSGTSITPDDIEIVKRNVARLLDSPAKE